MHWSDTAIILSTRKHGESSAIIRLFAREHGVHCGIMRGAQSKKNRGIAHPGNVVNASWSARMAEQLGNFKLELMEAVTALVMKDARALAALSAGCELLETGLPEHHPYTLLYERFFALTQALKTAENYLEPYVQFELELLAESGFGLDLRQCAASGATDELIYVSPKSGKAVSREAGEPYKDKLLPLPSFLLPGHTHLRGNDPVKEILAGMQLTGYFLTHWLLAPHNRQLPASRQRLIGLLLHEEQ